MLGSWICSRCGSELCLPCHDLIRQSSITGFGATNDGDSVTTCRPLSTSPNEKSTERTQRTQPPRYSRHDASTFFPIARLSITRLRHDYGLALWVQARMGTEAADFVNTYLEKAAYEKGKIKKQALRKTKNKPHQFWLQTRAERARETGHKGLGAVISVSVREDEETRARRIMEALLVATEPFVVEQDAVPPLSDDALRALVPGDTKVELRFQTAKDQDPERAEWTWSKVADELTRPKGKGTVSWLDLRDFPNNGSLHALGSGAATEMFARATMCPGSAGFHSYKRDAKKSTIWNLQALGDIASWAEIEGRDAQEKFYVASPCINDEWGAYRGTTLLHVDEGGAANVALWTKLSNGERTNNERPVVAEWLWWKPQARAYFDQAAMNCLEDAESKTKGGSTFTQDHWDGKGDALYSQALTATDRYVDEVAKLGGEDCRARIIRQRIGDTVFILPGFPHQVRNLRLCLKIAKDFMSPTGIEQMLQVQRERAAASVGHDHGRDACMIRLTIYRAWRAMIAELSDKDKSNTASLQATIPVIVDLAVAKANENVRELTARVDDLEVTVEALKAQAKLTLNQQQIAKWIGEALLKCSE
ncbi:hypothetical protein OC846_005911 [Tilletia horrida]|uniref:JmjC domain-containing protein n=1 Tax=Tilletia horrida TaxID=155126 RepID=A0AAN6GM54_9BASI|nr:hypothetical protein OC846_005911 [Tilletia horrida]KAK0560263.1 hypothetical protein OC861_006337 [Tilletia horrida]